LLHARVGRRRAGPVDPAADRRPRLQGVGGAIITPLTLTTLTILTGAVPAEKRGAAFGAWSGVHGLAVAIGPLVGGAVTEGISWQWIFWLNVPIGLIALSFARTKLTESYGPNKSIDLPGSASPAPDCSGSSGRGNSAGWLSPEITGAAVLGIAALVGFIAWELRTATPMLPMRFFRNRAFAAANTASLAMFFGMFGSVFLLTQFLQLVMGYSPLQAGVRTLAWTAMPLFIAPAAGALSDRIGGRPIMAFGLALDAIAFGWIAYNAKVGMSYGQLLPALVLAGIGTASFVASVANVVMSAGRPDEAGQASGAINAIREIGGVLGLAVLAAGFSARGGYATPGAFVDGFVPALTIGAITVAIGAAAALLIPPLKRATATSLKPAVEAASWPGRGHPPNPIKRSLKYPARVDRAVRRLLSSDGRDRGSVVLGWLRLQALQGRRHAHCGPPQRRRPPMRPTRDACSEPGRRSSGAPSLESRLSPRGDFLRGGNDDRVA
jgi:MFS family permease